MFANSIQSRAREAKILSVEGSSRLRRHRHVTISPSKQQDANDSGHVTKIELELEEAPDDTILVGSMPSGLDGTGEINSTYPDGIPAPGTVVVRAEEALIVVLVLLLWVAAIALFFNRWGKIRMLEPYQPKFQQQHRQSCAVEPNTLQHRTYSKFNIHCTEHSAALHQVACASGTQPRPRQNSVIVGSSASLLQCSQDTPRRTKSAFDIQSLVLAESNSQDDKEEDIQDLDNFKFVRQPSESTRLLQKDRRISVCQFGESVSRPLQRERGMSICHFDRMEVVASPLQRERGMSSCQFDRMEVLARPLQRERGMSICHFDRTDVLARPLQKDRHGSSICHFDRMDVLARPSSYLNRSLTRERRVSVCNFMERDEELQPNRGFLRDRRSSAESGDRSELTKPVIKEEKSCLEKQEIFAKCTPREKATVYCYDRPSCSKTTDPVLGYKATCV